MCMCTSLMLAEAIRKCSQHWDKCVLYEKSFVRFRLCLLRCVVSSQLAHSCGEHNTEQICFHFIRSFLSVSHSPRYFTCALCFFGGFVFHVSTVSRLSLFVGYRIHFYSSHTHSNIRQRWNAISFISFAVEFSVWRTEWWCCVVAVLTLSLHVSKQRNACTTTWDRTERRTEMLKKAFFYVTLRRSVYSFLFSHSFLSRSVSFAHSTIR